MINSKGLRIFMVLILLSLLAKGIQHNFKEKSVASKQAATTLQQSLEEIRDMDTHLSFGDMVFEANTYNCCYTRKTTKDYLKFTLNIRFLEEGSMSQGTKSDDEFQSFYTSPTGHILGSVGAQKYLLDADLNKVSRGYHDFHFRGNEIYGNHGATIEKIELIVTPLIINL